MFENILIPAPYGPDEPEKMEAWLRGCQDLTALINSELQKEFDPKADDPRPDLMAMLTLLRTHETDGEEEASKIMLAMSLSKLIWSLQFMLKSHIGVVTMMADCMNMTVEEVYQQMAAEQYLEEP